MLIYSWTSWVKVGRKHLTNHPRNGASAKSRAPVLDPLIKQTRKKVGNVPRNYFYQQYPNPNLLQTPTLKAVYQRWPIFIAWVSARRLLKGLRLLSIRNCGARCGSFFTLSSGPPHITFLSFPSRCWWFAELVSLDVDSCSRPFALSCKGLFGVKE